MLCEFVRVPRVSNWAKFVVQISKDEAPTPLLTVGLLFIFGHLLCIHFTTLKIHSVSQTSPNFEQTTSLEVVNNSENPVPICISRDASMERLLAGRYQAVWGFAVRRKSGRSGAKWDIYYFKDKGFGRKLVKWIWMIVWSCLLDYLICGHFCQWLRSHM